jgi:redox-sensitive bicupin YhaK (pirin superfamily)
MKESRRLFIGKLTLGLTAIFSWPFAQAGKRVTDEVPDLISPTATDVPAERVAAPAATAPHPVKSIKQMGFQWDTQDPFLFCVHHEDKFPKGNDLMGPAASLSGRDLGNDFIIKDGYRMYHGKQVPGFPGHPHRGFETITVVREGLVDHADSIGAAGRYGNGDVQWMTAGAGVQHSEMFPLLSKTKENPLELFQIWLNLPRKNKMVPPHFKMLWREDIPVLTKKDAQGKVSKIEVIAGKLGTTKAPAPPPNSWAADPINEIAVWNIRMESGAQMTLPKASKGINRTLYYYLGSGMQISGKQVPGYRMVEVAGDADLLLKNGADAAGILVLQGRPIGEEVIQYGPFVMNSKQEIQQAFEDFHRTKFGGWPWSRYDQVHGRNEGRFARHADGRMERKGNV